MKGPSEDEGLYRNADIGHGSVVKKENGDAKPSVGSVRHRKGLKGICNLLAELPASSQTSTGPKLKKKWNGGGKENSSLISVMPAKERSTNQTLLERGMEEKKNLSKRTERRAFAGKKAKRKKGRAFSEKMTRQIWADDERGSCGGREAASDTDLKIKSHLMIICKVMEKQGNLAINFGVGGGGSCWGCWGKAVSCLQPSNLSWRKKRKTFTLKWIGEVIGTTTENKRGVRDQVKGDRG